VSVETPDLLPMPATPTVLVIDDDAAVRDLMARFLDKLGYRGIAAPNGPEGLRLARQVRPDVITLDVVMPQMNGWDVLEQLKADPELASVPVIMVTIDDREAVGLARGAANYLIKPIDKDRLAEAIDRHLLKPESDPVDMMLTYSGDR
jgi:CheY-like chemotaxis protein